MKRSILLLAVLSLAVRPLCGAPSAPDDTSAVAVPPGKQYIYKESGGKPRDLEVYFPQGWEPSKNKVTGVIFFHGGSWTGGNLDQFRYACRYLASRGLVAATVNYRMLAKKDRASLAGGESYKRACITDARSAIRWMKQHAGELGIDPQRLIAGGGSAGGHIAVLAPTTPGLDDPADPQGFDTRVAAYLLFNPAFKDTDSADPQVDVLQHLTKDFPPAIFFFGDKDRGWKPGSDALRERLKSQGNTATELWIAEGQGHGFFNRPPWQDVTLAQADRFLVEHGFLKGNSTLPPPPDGEKLVQAP